MIIITTYPMPHIRNTNFIYCFKSETTYEDITQILEEVFKLENEEDMKSLLICDELETIKNINLFYKIKNGELMLIIGFQHYYSLDINLEYLMKVFKEYDRPLSLVWEKRSYKRLNFQNLVDNDF